MAVDDVYVAQMFYRVAGEECVSRIHLVETVKCNSPIEALAVCRVVQTYLLPIMLPWIPTTVKYDRVYCRRVFPEPGPTGETYPGGGGILPLQDANIPAAPMVISFRAFMGTPVRRGRMYWSGFAEEDQLAGNLDAAVEGTFQPWIDNFMKPLSHVNPDTSGEWRAALFNPAWETAFPIDDARIRPNLGTMRTRRRKSFWNIP